MPSDRLWRIRGYLLNHKATMTSNFISMEAPRRAIWKSIAGWRHHGVNLISQTSSRMNRYAFAEKAGRWFFISSKLGIQSVGRHVLVVRLIRKDNIENYKISITLVFWDNFALLRLFLLGEKLIITGTWYSAVCHNNDLYHLRKPWVEPLWGDFTLLRVNR
jgi:hypothetical protein